MKNHLAYIILVLLATSTIQLKAQVKVTVENGRILVGVPWIKPNEKKLQPIIDTLDRNLKANPNDTTSLFCRAVLYLNLNDIMAKPYQGTIGALENLVKGKDMAEKAIDLKMQDFRLKILRAQLYSELAYRFTGDESWKFNSKQIAERRKQFNNYKELANKYYDELAVLDKTNAYDYQKLKVNSDYPIK